MASTVPAFVQALRESQLLEPAQLEEIGRHPTAKGADARLLAKDLMQRGWLTAYQVNLLLQGRGKELAIGPFRLLDRLGEGSLGKVFKACHVATGRVIAIKVIPRLGAATASRLANEIQAVERKGH